MKKRLSVSFSIFFVGLLVGLLPVQVAAAQESLKVGFVDLVRIREQYKAYQAAINDIKQIKEKEQVNLDEMSSEFDRAVKNYDLKEGLWPSESEKQAELEKLKQKWSILTDYKNTKDQELEAKSREKIQPLLETIKNTVHDVAAKNGFHLIFRKSDLWYSDPRLDITDLVLKVLNGE